MVKIYLEAIKKIGLEANNSDELVEKLWKHIEQVEVNANLIQFYLQ